MRALPLAALLLVLAALAPVAAGPREDAFRSIIGRQLEAFKRDDGPAAFAFASPTIQGMFGSAENFMTMVERGYPPVYRAHNYQFLNVIEADGRIFQRVRIEGPDGEVVVAVYEMLEVEGAWRINGCYLTKPEEA